MKKEEAFVDVREQKSHLRSKSFSMSNKGYVNNAFHAPLGIYEV